MVQLFRMHGMKSALCAALAAEWAISTPQNFVHEILEEAQRYGSWRTFREAKIRKLKYRMGRGGVSEWSIELVLKTSKGDEPFESSNLSPTATRHSAVPAFDYLPAEDNLQLPGWCRFSKIFFQKILGPYASA